MVLKGSIVTIYTTNKPILNGVGRWVVVSYTYVDQTLGRIGQLKSAITN